MESAQCDDFGDDGASVDQLESKIAFPGGAVRADKGRAAARVDELGLGQVNDHRATRFICLQGLA